MKTKTYLFFLIILFTKIVTAQIYPAQKDSLLLILKNKHINSQLSINIYKTLSGDYYMYNDPDSAKYFARKLLDISKVENHLTLQAESLDLLGLAEAYLSEYNSAEQHLKKSINIYKNTPDKTGLGKAYRDLSLLYSKTKRPYNAIYAFKALKIFEQQPDTLLLADIYLVIGDYYLAGNNINKFSEYTGKAKSLIGRKNSSLQSRLYRNLTLLSYYKNNDSIFYFLNNRFKIDSLKYSLRDLLFDYLHKGEILFYYNQQNDSAIFYHKKSLELAEKVFKPMRASIYLSMSMIYNKINKYDESNKILLKTIRLLEQENDWNTKEIALLKLYDNYKKLNKKDSLSDIIDAIINTNDTLYTDKTNSMLKEMEAQLTSEKKEERIIKLQQKSKRDRLIKIVLTIFIILFMIISILTYRNIQYRKKRIQAEKEKAEQEVRYKTKQLTSQALMMLQKNKLLDEILKNLSEIKEIGLNNKKQLQILKRKLKKTIHSEEDWELFKHYFEDINKDFFEKLKAINSKITPSEMKLAALIKLRFNIKETAELLNQSPESVKTARYQLRKKLNMQRSDNLYSYLNSI